MFSFLFLRVFDSTLVGGVSRDERPVAPSSYALVTRSKVKEKETNGITHATVSRNGHPSSFLFLFFLLTLARFHQRRKRSHFSLLRLFTNRTDSAPVA